MGRKHAGKNQFSLGVFLRLAVGFLRAFSLQDWATIIGILFAVGTFANNWYYRKKSYKLLQQHPELRDLYEESNR